MRVTIGQILAAASLVFWIPFEGKAAFHKPPPLSGFTGDVLWETGRCAAFGDSLDPGQAAGRLAWAMRCNEVRREEARLNMNLDELVRTEMNGNLFVSANAQNNSRDRGLYPTFGVLNDDGQRVNPAGYKAPIVRDFDCRLPELYDLVTFCVEGCYASAQTLDFGLEELTIPQAMEAGRRSIQTLAEDSTLDSLQFQYSPIESYVVTLGEGTNDQIRIETEAGRTLTVTPDHGVLQADGIMVQASELRVGIPVLGQDGRPDPVASLSSLSPKDKVFNLFVRSESPILNVVSAGGVMNGTAFFQNEGVRYLNRLLFRVRLPDSLIQN